MRMDMRSLRNSLLFTLPLVGRIDLQGVGVGVGRSLRLLFECYGETTRPPPLTPPHKGEGKSMCYIFFISSVTTDVQAPSGFLEMTGSEPPFISVSTVRSAAATSSVPSEPSVSLLISCIMVFW